MSRTIRNASGTNLLLFLRAGGEFVERLVDKVSPRGVAVIQLGLSTCDPFGDRDSRGLVGAGNSKCVGDFAEPRP